MSEFHDKKLTDVHNQTKQPEKKKLQNFAKRTITNIRKPSLFRKESMTSLTKWFENFPRFESGLKVASKLSPLDHNRYLHSLFNYFILAAILLFVVNSFILFGCFFSAFRARKKNFSSRNRSIKFWIIVVVCIGIASFSIGLVANDSLYLGIKKLCHPFEEIGEKHDELLFKTSEFFLLKTLEKKN